MNREQRRQRTAKARPVRHAARNNVAIAKYQVALLPPEFLQAKRSIGQQAVEAFRLGRGTLAHWLRLCTMVNVALAIEDQGIVKGLKAQLMEAHFALQAISERMEKTGVWVPGALRAVELEAIRALVDWHLFQLSKLSNSEYDAAYDLARGHVTSAGGEVVNINSLEEA